MKKQGKQNKTEQTFFAASASDCTGLIPSGITDDEMLDAYNELMPIYPDLPTRKKD